MKCSGHRAVLLVMLLSAIAGAGNVGAAEPRVHLLIPAYFYPAGPGLQEWTKLFDSPARAQTVVIVNPASGPGTAADPNYTSVVKQAKKAGLTLIGYVTTSYGKRPVAQVKTDIDDWLRLYPGLGGIFFDEQASDEAHVAYQAELYRYVKTTKKLGLVVTNPGTICAEGYLSEPASDVVCLFEGPLAAESLNFPSWTSRYPPARIAALPYQVATADDMHHALRSAVERGIGYLDITDAHGTTVWERLPRYWPEVNTAVIALDRDKPTKPAR